MTRRSRYLCFGAATAVVLGLAAYGIREHRRRTAARETKVIEMLRGMSGAQSMYFGEAPDVEEGSSPPHIAVHSLLRDRLPENWVLADVDEGQVTPVHWASGPGFGISAARKGDPDRDWKIGKGGYVRVWLMLPGYEPSKPLHPPGVAQVGAALEHEPIGELRVFVWGGGGSDWPTWRKDADGVLQEVRSRGGQ